MNTEKATRWIDNKKFSRPNIYAELFTQYYHKCIINIISESYITFFIITVIINTDTVLSAFVAFKHFLIKRICYILTICVTDP